MILYIDETESDRLFIVTGLLAISNDEVISAYKRFKKSLKNYRISNKQKERVFVEFKSTFLDKHYQKIKIRMLEEINNIDDTIIYSVAIKKNPYFKQKEKEGCYIELLGKIIDCLDSDTEIIFDAFGQRDFENKIIKSFENHPKVTRITPQDSQINYGLQFVDNLCSVMRLHETNTDVDNYYRIIAHKIKKT